MLIYKRYFMLIAISLICLISFIKYLQNRLKEYENMKVNLKTKLYTISINRSSKSLGRNGNPNRLEVVNVDELKGNVINVAGSGHSLAINDEGKIFSWGRNDSKGGGGYGSPPINDSGQLGYPRINNLNTSLSMVMINSTDESYFVKVSAGRYHSVALDSKGRVYTWGLNDYGQLARKAFDKYGEFCYNGSSCHSPLVKEINWENIKNKPYIIDIATGRYFSIALDLNGKLYTWGLNFCGNINNLTLNNAFPKTINLPFNIKVKKLSCGYNFWAIIDMNGHVYTCSTLSDGYGGKLLSFLNNNNSYYFNKDGELGFRTNKENDIIFLNQLDFSHENRNVTIVDIACGRCFGIAMSDNGELYSWGCHGFSKNQSIKKINGFGEKNKAIKIASGEYHAHVINEHGDIFIWGETGGSIFKDITFIAEPKKLNYESDIIGIDIACGYQHSLIIAKN